MTIPSEVGENKFAGNEENIDSAVISAPGYNLRDQLRSTNLRESIFIIAFFRINVDLVLRKSGFLGVVDFLFNCFSFIIFYLEMSDEGFLIF